MKILFISNLNPHFENTNTYRLKAIEEMGHKPIFFEDRNFILPGRIRQEVAFLQDWDLRRLNRRMIKVAERVKPDICLAVGGYRITGDTLIDLKQMGVKTALWTTDVPRPEFNQIVATASLYDHIFCAGTEAMEVLAKAGIRDSFWLPFACDPDYHRPVDLTDEDRKNYGRDLIFVGAFYPNRWEVLKELVGIYDIGIWGPGWQQVVDHRNRDCIHASHLQYTEWVKMYNAAKIIIIIHYQDGAIPCFQASPKVFEALACRSFVISDSQKDVFRLFSSGKQLVCFNDIQDLKTKIEHFLNRDEERRMIAAAGYEEVLHKHTYRHRLHEMLNHIGRRA
jgi:spore maturation protein CgeB